MNLLRYLCIHRVHNISSISHTCYLNVYKSFCSRNLLRFLLSVCSKQMFLIKQATLPTPKTEQTSHNRHALSAICNPEGFSKRSTLYSLQTCSSEHPLNFSGKSNKYKEELSHLTRVRWSRCISLRSCRVHLLPPKS